MKVVAVERPPCDVCVTDGFRQDERVVRGRVYTVLSIHRLGGHGSLFEIAELPLPPCTLFCSCGFSEIDGDMEAWQRVMQKNRPKTKELEPA